MSEKPTAPTLGLLFHESSKLARSDQRFGRRLNAFMGNRLIQDMASRPFKRYHGAARVVLPAALEEERGGSFAAVLATRRSATRLAGGPLELAALGRLLWSSSGLVLSLRPHPAASPVHLRCSPSAGALYPLETYVAATAVDGLAPGLYHYDPPDHALELLRPGDPTAEILATIPRDIGRPAAVIVLAALFRRTLAKYGERGYRFVLMEAGHAAQNLLLAATAADLASIPLGGFLDDELARLFDLDGFEEAPVYMVAVAG